MTDIPAVKKSFLNDGIALAVLSYHTPKYVRLLQYGILAPHHNSSPPHPPPHIYVHIRTPTSSPRPQDAAEHAAYVELLWAAGHGGGARGGAQRPAARGARHGPPPRLPSAAAQECARREGEPRTMRAKT